MKSANLRAGLVGIIAVEAYRRELPAGQIDALVEEIWHQASGSNRPPENGAKVLPTILDAVGVDRLLSIVAQRFSPTIAQMLLADRRHGHIRDHGLPAGQIVHDGLPDMQTRLYRDLLVETSEKLDALSDKPEETAESTLRALWHAANGTPMSAERAMEWKLPLLDETAVSRLRSLLGKRFSGVPLAHLSGQQRFMGIELMTGPDALVPRKETELLGHLALAVLRQLTSDGESVRVIDVCTGAGNLALSLAVHAPGATVFGSDLSDTAVELARRNSAMLELQYRVRFRQGDFLEPFADGEFDRNIDVLVCNPPYISSGKVGAMPSEIIGFEPALAFDGGPFGVKIIQRLLSEAPRYVRPGGWLALEVGLGQGPAIMERIRRNAAYAELAAVVDAEGAVRSVLARVH